MTKRTRTGVPYDPAQHDIQFWRKCRDEGMAAEFAASDLRRWGLSDPREQRWFAEDMLNNALAAYALTQPQTVYLRDNEQVVEMLTEERERHCSWGRHSLAGEPCRKPVVQIRWRWEPEHGKKMNSTGVMTAWRHADGTPLHRNPDEQGRPEFMWEQYTSCEPIPMCGSCGQEWLDSHCDVCHKNGALHTKMEAYGDRTRCTTPGCTRKETYYSIGD